MHLAQLPNLRQRYFFIVRRKAAEHTGANLGMDIYASIIIPTGFPNEIIFYCNSRIAKLYLLVSTEIYPAVAGNIIYNVS
jgi:hypothetical protein